MIVGDIVASFNIVYSVVKQIRQLTLELNENIHEIDNLKLQAETVEQVVRVLQESVISDMILSELQLTISKLTKCAKFIETYLKESKTNRFINANSLKSDIQDLQKELTNCRSSLFELTLLYKNINVAKGSTRAYSDIHEKNDKQDALDKNECNQEMKFILGLLNLMEETKSSCFYNDNIKNLWQKYFPLKIEVEIDDFWNFLETHISAKAPNMKSNIIKYLYLSENSKVRFENFINLFESQTIISQKISEFLAQKLFKLAKSLETRESQIEIEESVEYYQFAFNFGSVEASEKLGDLYMLGTQITLSFTEQIQFSALKRSESHKGISNINMAIKYYEKAMVKDNNIGLEQWVSIYTFGIGGKPNPDYALKILKKLYNETKSSNIAYWIAYVYENHTDEAKLDEAKKWYLNASSNGDIRAMNWIGISYSEDGDHLKAFEILFIAFENSSMDAGNCSSLFSHVLALNMLRISIANTSFLPNGTVKTISGIEIVSNEIQIGRDYLSGEVINRDVKQAKIWFEKKGNIDSEIELAKLLYNDLDKFAYSKRAYTTFLKGVEQGIPEAYYYLARMYDDNLVEEQNTAENFANHSEKAYTLYKSAALTGHLDSMISIFFKYKVQEFRIPVNENCILHHVCKFGNQNSLQLLLSLQYLDINSTNALGNTALHESVLFGKKASAILLISQKANPNILNMVGKSALHILSENGNMLQVISDQMVFNYDLQSKTGETCLHYAVINCHLPIVMFLCSRNIAINLQNEAGNTALHCAATNGYKNIVQTLMHYNADTSIFNKLSQTPLIIAVINNFSELVKLFIKQKVNLDQQDSKGWHALFFASVRGYHEIGSLLCKSGSNVNLKDYSGHTAIYCAVVSGRPEMVKILYKHKADMETLYDGRSLLHLAIFYRNFEMAKLLIKLKINPDVLDSEGNSILSRAIFYGQEETVRLILHSLKIDINLQSSTGMTALMNAVNTNQIEIVQNLLQCGANVTLKTKKGIDCLKMACMNGNLEMAKILISSCADVNQLDNFRFNALHSAILDRCVIKVTYALMRLYRGFETSLMNYKEFDDPRYDIFNLEILLKDITEEEKSTINFVELGHNFNPQQLSIIKYLTQCNCSTETKNNFGQTPMDIILRLKQLFKDARYHAGTHHFEAITNVLLGVHVEIHHNDKKQL